MTGYRLSRNASRSIDDIYDYTAARWGTEQADRYVDRLGEAFDQLARDPELGRRRPDVPPSLRALTIASHVVVYGESDGMVDIIEILHVAMNIPARIASALGSRQTR